MKKTLILFVALFLCAFFAHAQILLQESFESSTFPSGWTVVDNDNDGHNWMPSESSVAQAINPYYYTHSGDGCALSESYDDMTYSPLTPDNWLITPAITLTGNNISLKFWVSGLDGMYSEEGYSVYISTTGANVSDFTTQLTTGYTSPGYAQKTVDLSTYAGQTVYIAFRHHNCTNQYLLGLDDVEIYSAPTTPTIETAFSQINFGNLSTNLEKIDSISITAYNLTADVIATAYAPFEVSSDNTTFGSVANIASTGGILYVKYAPTIVGVDSSVVTLSSSAAADVTISVTGRSIEVAQLPYVQDFEDTENAENENWFFAGSGINQWAIGSATNATTSGQKSLYISSDNGINNYYSVNDPVTSYSWAYRDIDFGTYAEYILSFKYKGVGESGYDYLRVYIGSPADIPSGAVAPSGALLIGAYNDISNWTTYTYNIPSTYSGIQRLYFMWQNDSSWGDNPPAAIDDISVVGMDCGTPMQPILTQITPNGATFEINPASAQDTEWEFMLISPVDTIIDLAYDTILTFTNLIPNTPYSLSVRTVCTDGEYSDWSSFANFRTDCEVIVAPYFESFSGFNVEPSNCWNKRQGIANDIFNGGEFISNSSNWNFTSQNLFSLGHPSLNIWGENCKHWLISPSIDVSGLTSPTLSFSLALTSYNSTNPIADNTAQADDKFMVVISSDNGVTWSAANAIVWDNTSSGNYSFNNISPIGQDIQISLSQYAGQTIKVAFYGESTISGNGDNDLHISDFSIGEVNTCPRPISVNIDSVNTTEVFFSWIPDGTESMWEYSCAIQGEIIDEESVTWTLAYDTVGSVTNLQPNTPYVVYVRALCDNSEVSTFRFANFRTGCSQENIPYIEDFSSYQNLDLPTCWTFSSTYLYADTELDNYTYNTAPASLGFYSYGSDVYNMAITPRIDDNVNLNTLVLSFYYKLGSSYDQIIVGTMSDPNEDSTFHQLATVTSSIDSWKTFEDFALTNAPADDHYIAFKYISAFGYMGYIDDISLMIPSSCQKPSIPTINVISSNSVSFSWEENGNAMNWNIAYGPSGFNITDETTIIPVSETNFTAENLTPNTTYDFYIQADCGDALSNWRGPISITSGAYNCGIVGVDTITACDITIYDCGGANDDYNSNSNHTLVVYPEGTENSFLISGIYSVEEGYDFLTIYEGVGTNGNILFSTDNSLSGSGSLPAGLTCSSGPITITFISDGSTNYDGFAINITCSNCVAPALSLANVSATDATFTWSNQDGDQTEWQVAIGSVGFTPTAENSENIYGTPSVTFSGLTANTNYWVYIRTYCNGDYSYWSTPFAFSTATTSPAQVPYMYGFEDAIENAAWTLVNDNQTNKWRIGQPIGETDSVLFVSDNPNTETYNVDATSHSWAYRDIQFGEGSEFLIDIKWKALGETGDYDYLKVYLGMPSPVTAGSENAPANPILVSPVLHQNTTWQHYHGLVNSSVANTTQRLYLYWYNDQSWGNAPAAVVDSISITVLNCARPMAVTTNNVTTTSVDVTITPARDTDSEWEYKVCAAGINPDSVIAQTTYSDQFTISNLNSGSDYDIYVRTSCGSGEYSLWTDAVSFTTLCASISQVPQVWNFESNNNGGTEYDPLPSCWERPIGTSNPYVSEYSYNAHSGNNSLTCGYDANDVVVALPIIATDVLPINTLQLTFYAKGSYGGTNTVEVGVMESISGTFTPITTFNIQTSVYTEYTAMLNSYVGDNQYIAIRFNSDEDYIYMDDVTLETIPTCPKPSELTVSNISQTSAELAWLAGGTETTWDIAYGPVGFDIDTEGTIVSTSSNPFTLTGLTSSTIYEVYVRANCGGGDISNWCSMPVTFLTSICDSTEQCEYTFICTDSYGDGWNNATLIVKQNDIIVANVEALNHGGDGSLAYTDTIRIMLCDNTPTIFAWATGNYDNEISLTILDPFGNQLFTSSNMMTVASNPLLSFTTSCTQTIEPCDAPTNVQVTPTANTADVTWTSTADAWIVEYKEATAANWTASATLTANNYNITGLTATTDYVVRVKAICDTITESDWSAEMPFTTLAGQVTTYVITASASGPGTIAPSGTITVQEGSDVTFIFEADENAVVDRLLVDDAETAIPANNEYTFSAVVANHTIAVEFVEETGIEEIDLNAAVALYPNPATSQIQIQVADSRFLGAEMQIFDVYGKLISNTTIETLTTQVDVSQLANGMYMVRINATEGMVTKRFVKR